MVTFNTTFFELLKVLYYVHTSRPYLFPYLLAYYTNLPNLDTTFYCQLIILLRFTHGIEVRDSYRQQAIQHFKMALVYNPDNEVCILK